MNLKRLCKTLMFLFSIAGLYGYCAAASADSEDELDISITVFEPGEDPNQLFERIELPGDVKRRETGSDAPQQKGGKAYGQSASKEAKGKANNQRKKSDNIASQAADQAREKIKGIVGGSAADKAKDKIPDDVKKAIDKGKTKGKDKGKGRNP
ncbi:MAG: hypothetical protein P8Y45_19160 [Exilibacterium sp.]